MKKNSLGQYVSKSGRILVIPRMDLVMPWIEATRIGWTVHNLDTRQRVHVRTFREAQRIVKIMEELPTTWRDAKVRKPARKATKKASKKATKKASR